MPVVARPSPRRPLVILASSMVARVRPMLPPAYQPVVSWAIAWAWAAEAPNRASAATASVTGVLMNVMWCLSWIGCRGSRNVDHGVDHGHRGIERQDPAVDGGQARGAGG